MQLSFPHVKDDPARPRSRGPASPVEGTCGAVRPAAIRLFDPRSPQDRGIPFAGGNARTPPVARTLSRKNLAHRRRPRGARSPLIVIDASAVLLGTDRGQKVEARALAPDERLCFQLLSANGSNTEGPAGRLRGGVKLFVQFANFPHRPVVSIFYRPPR